MEQLLAYMQKEHLDGMFISRPVNVKYVSHYTGEDSWLFITEQEKFFLTDPRYTEQVSYECPDYTILNWRDTYGSIGKALAYAAEKVGAKTIGYEAAHLTVEQYQNLQSEVKAELVPADGIIEEFRSIKKPEEIECLRISCEGYPGRHYRERAGGAFKPLYGSGGRGYTAIWQYPHLRCENIPASWNSVPEGD